MPRFRQRVWLFPATFALHVLEEAPGFTSWARRYASERYTQRDFVRNNASGLALTVAGTWLVARRPTRPIVFAYFATVLTQQVPFNAVFHAAATVAFRAYSPGLASSLGQLPLWLHLTRLARRERLLTRRGERAATAIGGVVHAAAVGRQVFFLGPRAGRLRGDLGKSRNLQEERPKNPQFA